MIRDSMAHDAAGEPYDERTVNAVIALLEGSKHNIHKGAAKRVAEFFLPDGRIAKAREIAAANGWPIEAVLAGVSIEEVKA